MTAASETPRRVRSCVLSSYSILCNVAARSSLLRAADSRAAAAFVSLGLFFRRQDGKAGGSAARVVAGVAQRQPQREEAALADFALHEDVAAVFAHDLAADGQAQPRAARPFRADERPEQIRELVRRDTAAVVAHLHPQPFAFTVARRGDDDLRLLDLLHGVEGVADDVE